MWLMISIISLVLAVLTFFGVLRVLKLWALPMEYFERQYATIPKAGGRVVVSFDGDVGDAALKSVLDQTVRVDDIQINCGEYGRRGLATTYPVYKRRHPAVYATRREEDRDSIIIFLRDRIYGKDYIEHIVANTNDKPLTEKGKILALKPKFYDSDITDFSDCDFARDGVELGYCKNF